MRQLSENKKQIKIIAYILLAERSANNRIVKHILKNLNI